MHTSLRRDKDDVCRENPSTEGSFLETNLNYFFIIKMSPTYLRGFLWNNNNNNNNVNSTCSSLNINCLSRRGQTSPQMFRQFLGISHYFALLKKFWLFLHQTWQVIRWPIANYIYVKNVSKCQSCDVTVMTSCFLPLLKFLICIFFTMCSKEHIKGSWNLKKFCPYHKNWIKYGIFKYEK